MNGNPLTIILLVNSILVIVLILNQNDNSKDSANSQKTTAPLTFFEKATWFSVLIQISLLISQIKTIEL